ncbi:hypothetical protein QWY82_05100 [Simiduia curdlanivorans]|uniref:Uncharacterized protein n=1 Tax=Simiduia curdlanivorans TaxID=1492769 RepID=A0ABV8V3K9_9GAMM|nr:hypothetical protein [Simiduia curdlanivorans]MDN3638186.1 hypothetical protein [Simiduia curdlanivorans]
MEDIKHDIKVGFSPQPDGGYFYFSGEEKSLKLLDSTLHVLNDWAEVSSGYRRLNVSGTDLDPYALAYEINDAAGFRVISIHMLVGLGRAY